MKMRSFNQLFGGFCVLVNILALIAVLTGNHTLFGTVAVSVSMAVSIGMYLRVTIGMAALKVAEREEEIIDIAIWQRSDPEVVRRFSGWIRNNDRAFKGGKFVDIMRDTGDPDDPKFGGYWLLMEGTRSTYRKIVKELNMPEWAVTDYWPLDFKKWGDRLEDAWLDQEDGPIEELAEPADSDPIAELKG